MPELPDIAIYIEALEKRIPGVTLDNIRFGSPFLLRTISPSSASLHGMTVTELRRVGKRIAIGLDRAHWIVLHLMIAGRLRWRQVGAKLPGKPGLAAFDFSNGTLILTEAGSKRRASMHIVSGDEALRSMDPGGIEPLETDFASFATRLVSANHTLKRALTDPRLFSGIGNAYSDEILHAARLSPVALTQSLKPDEIERLWEATRTTLVEWIERLRAENGGSFPEKVTAFHSGMAAHGRYGQPCPICSTPIQRIRYAENETNYCPTCQTNGRLLADRSLSRLLKSDWPRSLDELELKTAARRGDSSTPI